MKENVLCNIENVRKAKKAVGYLHARPKTELPGFALMYGDPGVSKTRLGERLAYTHGMIYLRMQATATVKSFLQQMMKLINYKLPEDEKEKETRLMKKTTNQLYQKIIDTLNIHTDLIMIIDEFDHAVKNRKLRETIRDIGDETIASIILFGMENIYNDLKKESPYFFDRCITIVRFERLNEEDVRIICDEVSDEVTIADDLVHEVFIKTKGNIRQVIKYIYLFEKIAKEKNLTQLSLSDFEGEQE